MAELCGVKKGLEITWTMGFQKIVVEIDAGAVIKLLNKGESLASHPNAVVREIYELKRRNWNIHFVQIYREGGNTESPTTKQRSSSTQAELMTVLKSEAPRKLRAAEQRKLAQRYPVNIMRE
ncbi:uncharacterized protein LOC130950408 [Arachis stenosperma]|uniref:uncharacterized protein LOC130950408 n=1 Tax=Arachis stenosperma TaxID=217475 RepID=UPI0025AD2DF0|nr:uncharacterized protein LOC130950408 [Arachis stenosperma]